MHLPPENLVAGAIQTPAGDVWALGVTAYRLLNGDEQHRVAQQADDPKTLIFSGKYPAKDQYLPHIHGKLRRCLDRALHADPAKRWESASVLRRQLEMARPTVSWTPHSEPSGGSSWTGVDQAGVQWHAQLNGADDRWEFSLTKQLPGKQPRQQRAGALRAASPHDAHDHAAAVLQKLATDGSLT